MSGIPCILCGSLTTEHHSAYCSVNISSFCYMPRHIPAASSDVDCSAHSVAVPEQLNKITCYDRLAHRFTFMPHKGLCFVPGVRDTVEGQIRTSPPPPSERTYMT